mgnify:CR=1 FL=1
MIVPRPRLGILDEERQVRALPPGEGRGRRRARRDRARPIGGGGRSGPAGRRGSMRKTGITVAERWDGWGRGLPTGDLRRTPGHVRADGRAPGARPWPPLWDRRPCRQNAAEGAAGREREVPGGLPGGRSGVDGVRPRTGRDGVGQEGSRRTGSVAGPQGTATGGRGVGGGVSGGSGVRTRGRSPLSSSGVRTGATWARRPGAGRFEARSEAATGHPWSGARARTPMPRGDQRTDTRWCRESTDTICAARPGSTPACRASSSTLSSRCSAIASRTGATTAGNR